MAKFAIVRQDGEVDLAEGSSVGDVANTYGWPGNGTIEEYDPERHDGALRFTFTSPAHQRELLSDDHSLPQTIALPAPEGEAS